MEIYFDGGCKPNPGNCEIAIAIPSINLKLHERLGYGTNNQAEWLALLWAMEIAIERRYDDITLKGDSLLVINQAKGVWKCKKTELRVFLEEYQLLKYHFKKIKLEHVLRDKNLAGHVIEEIN